MEEIHRLDAFLDLSRWTLFVADALFGMKAKWRKAFLEELARRPCRARKVWLLIRVDLVDREDLELMKRAILLYPGGTSFSAVSASSAIQNVKALLSDEPLHNHSPGPNGLPGGYPLVISREGVEVDLPPALSLDEAIAMNLEAQTYDGIERVDEDARVHFMPYAVEIMRDMLGFDCASFTPDECEELAREQMDRFQAYERRVSGG